MEKDTSTTTKTTPPTTETHDKGLLERAEETIVSGATTVKETLQAGVEKAWETVKEGAEKTKEFFIPESTTATKEDLKENVRSTKE
jgi:hypothetical protein